jgi:predicted DNA-binding transcriptional regulator YafY
VKFGDIVLSGTQNMIIQMIEANNQVSAKRIAEEMSLSVRGVEKT